jgi:hypothetical protein
MGRARSMHKKWQIYTKSWPENLKGRDNLGDLDVDGRIILELKSTIFWDITPCSPLSAGACTLVSC